jgi:ribose 5-phosphate isomerase B
MLIYIANDHAGYDLKQEIITHLGIHFSEFRVCDLGTDSRDSVDYPLCAHKLAIHMKDQPDAIGILICGTGLGMSIAANRFPYLRAVHCSTGLDAELARRHNNANVLCLGGRIHGVELANHILDQFLQHPFEKGRHQKRVEQLEALGQAVTRLTSEDLE